MERTYKNNSPVTISFAEKHISGDAQQLYYPKCCLVHPCYRFVMLEKCFIYNNCIKIGICFEMKLCVVGNGVTYLLLFVAACRSPLLLHHV